jgi:hypothetical protein
MNLPTKNTGEEVEITSRVIPTAENRNATAKASRRPSLSATQPAVSDPTTALFEIRIESEVNNCQEFLTMLLVLH